MTSSGPTKPIPDGARQLTAHLRNSIGDRLRSVIWYDRGDHDVLYARQDVAAAYTEEEVKAVVDELSMESCTRPIKEELYTHGGLRCTVECYEDGIEMHFCIADGEGVAVGIEPVAFVEEGTFIGNCLEAAELVE
ncbi:DUF7522 family protein [Haloarcula amylovorans]|uniref:DUF7522 family protein n=1 Tax=Haloarcula amylovorans TaxID=2562280 RepID=UPI0010768F1E|nr:hypothetical protein [Halomicroarcula amylolytica]